MLPPMGPATAPSPGPRRRLSALRHRSYALFWAANVVSRTGTQMRDVALPWQLYLLTRSPLALGLLGAFRVAPVIALALGGGMVADAFDRRRVLLATQTVMTALSAALALLTYLGVLAPGGAANHTAAALIYLIVALNGAASAFDNPSRNALVVNLLPPEDLPNGLALNILGWQTASVVGPAVGGLLLGWTSIETVYTVDAVSFLAVIGALLVVRPRAPQRGAAADRGAAAEGGASPAGDGTVGEAAAASEPKPEVSLGAIKEAVAFLRTRPVLVWLMVVDFLATFFAGSMGLLPIFAADVFHIGARGLGWLTSAPAVGAVLASLWLSLRPPAERYGPLVLGAIVVYGASIAGFGVVGSFPVALALLAVSGAADTVSTVVRNIVRQTFVPDAMRGRLNSISMIFFMGGPQLGDFEAGVVAKLVSARFSVASGGIACVLSAVVVAALAPVLRNLRAEDRPGAERS
jgi:MFS family permease